MMTNNNIFLNVFIFYKINFILKCKPMNCLALSCIKVGYT